MPGGSPHALLLLTSALGLVVWPARVAAGDVETAKLVTKDAPTVDSGDLQLETGYTYASADRQYDNDGNRMRRGDLEGQIFTVVLTRGLRDGLDAAVELSWRDLIEDEDDALGSGIGNITIKAKWRIHQSRTHGVSISWLPGLTAFVEGDAAGERVAPGQAYWSINNLLAITAVGERFNLSFDAGLSIPFGNDRDSARGDFVSDVAIGYQLNTWFQPTAELNYAYSSLSGEFDSRNLVFSAGAIMNVAESLRLDLGVSQVIDGRNANRSTSYIANFSMTF